jgi:hypothetical protein
MSLNHPRRIGLERSGPWIGVGGLFVLLWISLSTVVYAPWWGLVLALLMLVPQALVLSRWSKTRPAQCPWVPALGFLCWFVLVLAGVGWWGWHTGA